MTATSVIRDVTCLGCGCACDDIDVVTRDGRIDEARNACALGLRWFGDGQIPSACRANGNDAPVADAVSAAAALLRDSARPLIYLAPDISTEAQREATAIADLLRARLDSITSATASAFVLASQEHGLASATLGEIRNRADVVILWGIDLRGRYPRFTSRYAPEPAGLHVPHGVRSRTVIAVDVGAATSSIDADHRVAIDQDAELAMLTALEALVRAPAGSAQRLAVPSSVAWEQARALAPALMAARYIAFVFDAERDDRAARSPQRFAAIATLAQSLNGRTRCAAIGMRAGGNRSGADVTLVAQTGYPFGIDFSRGFPRYDPWHGSALTLFRARAIDAALVVGDPTAAPAEVTLELARIPVAVVGPRATTVALGARSVAIDTGVDGIHTTGTAYRADDVPLPLRSSLTGRRGTAETLRGLTGALLGMRAHGFTVARAAGDHESAP
jgi:formylmethanofuran dehydrogenase subunit B